jgi:hypothetical protein
MTISATDEGVRLLDAAPSPLQDRFRAEFAKLEEWEQTHMLATLQRIAAMMDAEELEASPVLTTGAAVTATNPTAPEPGIAIGESGKPQTTADVNELSRGD